MVAYAYNPSTWMVRQNDRKFEASMGIIKIPYLKKNYVEEGQPNKIF